MAMRIRALRVLAPTMLFALGAAASLQGHAQSPAAFFKGKQRRRCA